MARKFIVILFLVLLIAISSGMDDQEGQVLKTLPEILTEIKEVLADQDKLKNLIPKSEVDFTELAKTESDTGATFGLHMMRAKDAFDLCRNFCGLYFSKNGQEKTDDPLNIKHHNFLKHFQSQVATADDGETLKNYKLYIDMIEFFHKQFDDDAKKSDSTNQILDNSQKKKGDGITKERVLAVVLLLCASAVLIWHFVTKEAEETEDEYMYDKETQYQHAIKENDTVIDVNDPKNQNAAEEANEQENKP